MIHLILFFFAILPNAAPDEVHHPVPKKPIYIEESWYATLKNALPSPPTPGSKAQSVDEKALFKLQKSRSKTDCESAKSEVFVSLKSFFGPGDGPIPAETLERLTPLFEQIRNDADFFIQKLKVEFPRKRPFLYVKGILPCVPKEVTGAYPSGHAVLSHLFATILSEIVPAHSAYLTTRASQISEHRVLSGMHHPSDIEAGKQIAQRVYAELKRSPKFLSDLAQAKGANVQ